jgi:hypothetical protein
VFSCNMSVDKFGRYLVGAEEGVSGRSKQGRPGVGYKLTIDKHYDIQNKRLTNVADAVAGNDVVNLDTLKRKTLYEENNIFDAKNKRICNVEQPRDVNDVVTLAYANTRYVDKNSDNMMMMMGDKTAFNAVGKRIKGLARAVEVNDAVTLQDVLALGNDSKGFFYDAKKLNIRNLKWPYNTNDAVTKEYVDTICPLMMNGYWSFKHLRLNGCADPIEEYDVVNLKTLTNSVYRLFLFILKLQSNQVVIPENIHLWSKAEVIDFFSKESSVYLRPSSSKHGEGEA